MADLAASLSQRLASTATGYAAVIDGILNVRTVTETRNMAAFNAMWVQGLQVVSTCQDVDCDCMVKLLSQLRPGTKIVAVQVGGANA